MEHPDMERADLESTITHLQDRVQFLEASVLLILMNHNLYTLLQEILLEGINDCAKWDDGETILETIKATDSWESLVGPNDLSDGVLDIFIKGVYTKLENYRRHGNLNS